MFPKSGATGLSNTFLTKLQNCVALCDQEQQVLIEAVGDARDISEGSHIVQCGDRAHFVHVLLSGWAMRYEILADGSRAITAFLLPGDLCDQHVTVLGVMDHSIMTLTKARVAYLPNGQLESIAQSYPRIAQALWWSTLVDEAVLRAWLVNIGRREAFEAIGHLLCELHARLAYVGLTKNADFELPITQEEIADAQGLSVVHVNRSLKRLRDDGYISLARGKLVINDVRRLRDVAGFDPGYLHRFPPKSVSIADRSRL
jgi:CRP-like cAMP-binding protein